MLLNPIQKEKERSNERRQVDLRRSILRTKGSLKNISIAKAKGTGRENV